MILKDISFLSPQENILYDEVLLDLAEHDQGEEVLRFWESGMYFVVLGRISKTVDDLNLEQVMKDKIPVVRRASGGGTVVQGKGCLNYSLVLSKEKTPQVSDLGVSYQFILKKIVLALRELHIETDYFPISDIAMIKNRKKVSGNAQKRGRRFILHHGTILYDFDIDLIERYLKIPLAIPEYREDRSHKEFVANVNLNAEDIKGQIAALFNVEHSESDLTQPEREHLAAYIRKRDVLIDLYPNATGLEN